MTYGIRELARLAGVSARTLRYYDQIGLLKPLYANEAGYRFYGEQELNILQQILFYRERGFELKQIQRILYEQDFNLERALEEHLQELEAKRRHVDTLIWTVKQTILSRKGEYDMSDEEKFQAFKEQVVQENEKQYGPEVRRKYGDEQMDAANQKLLHMSQEDYERFQNLGKEIQRQLKEAVEAGRKPESEEAKQIVLLHKEWLSMTWKEYTKEAHAAVAAGYICDQRFTRYYDQEIPGCAAFLEAAVRYWVSQC